MSQENRAFAVGVARAFGGALLFSLPILMTMETWQLGFSMERERLVLLIVLIMPILVGLSYYSGFEETTRLGDAAIDAFVAIAVASVMAVLILAVFGVLHPDMPLEEVIGKIAVQVVPGCIGALLAQSQFGKRSDEELAASRNDGDAAEYFMMAAGALFLCANVAPTEEVVLIAYMMQPWQSVVLCLLSIIFMHAFVYSVEFKGQHDRPADVSGWSVFIRFTIVGYAIAFLISAYICWSFGRFDGLPLREIVRITIVLAFPAAIGAAAARLVL